MIIFKFIIYASVFISIAIFVTGFQIDSKQKSNKRKYIYSLFLFPILYTWLCTAALILLLRYFDLDIAIIPKAIAGLKIFLFPLFAWLLSYKLRESPRWGLVILLLLTSPLSLNPIHFGIYHLIIFLIVLIDGLNKLLLNPTRESNSGTDMSQTSHDMHHKNVKAKTKREEFYKGAMTITLVLGLLYGGWHMYTYDRKRVGEYYVYPHKSRYLDQTVITKDKMYYRENLPTTGCITRTCSVLVDRKIIDPDQFEQDQKENYTREIKSRYKKIPKGSRLKVVKSFKYDTTKLIYRLIHEPRKMLIVQDSSGAKSEIPEYFLEYGIMKPAKEN